MIVQLKDKAKNNHTIKLHFFQLSSQFGQQNNAKKQIQTYANPLRTARKLTGSSMPST